MEPVIDSMAENADPYRTLGVGRSATADEIRKAFRSAAKECHPDLFPADPIRAERFKQISWAHGLLTDAGARARYDAAEQVRARTQHTARNRQSANTTPPRNERKFKFPGIDGANVDYSVTVSQAEAKSGVQKALSTTNGRTLRVAVPAGVRDCAVLRLRGQGMPGKFGGAAGDALITVRVALPPEFRVEKDGVHVDLDVPLNIAVLGGKLTAPTIDGPVTITVPRASNGGDVLRLRGRGVPQPGGERGDQFVHLRIVLPKPSDPELDRMLREWAARKIDAK